MSNQIRLYANVNGWLISDVYLRRMYLMSSILLAYVDKHTHKYAIYNNRNTLIEYQELHFLTYMKESVSVTISVAIRTGFL